MEIKIINHIPKLDGWECDELDYFPYDISNITYYNPIYSNFDTLDISYTNLQFNHTQHIYDNKHVIDNSGNITQQEIFFKYAPLLDPCHYMMGKYKYDKHITTIVKHNENQDYHEKLNSVHNASYVDNFTCALINLLREKHNFKHGVKYFGSIVGIQKQFRMNVVDDIEFLQEQEFFQEHIGNLFHTNIFSKELLQNETKQQTLKHKKSLSFSDDISLNDFDNITFTSGSIDTIPLHQDKASKLPEPELLELSIDNLEEHTDLAKNDDSDDSDVSDTDSNISDQNCNSSHTHSDEEEDNGYESSIDYDSSVEEEPLYAYIDNFPMIMIALSKCENTFDNLLNDSKDLDTDHYLSALFQIIMILLTLQKAFKFTHNDLHTNNIMYETTDIPYIYYMYNNIQYKVPTYGKIFKLIDFGRSIVTFNNNVYCSDSFKKDGDANTQYNFGPFYESTKKRIEPNYSFDLCRLGCSIYDFIIDDEGAVSDFDDFQKIIYEWCCDDNGKNMLYKKNGDERYPNFKLYKMIARVVHLHTPEKQLEREVFSKYHTIECIDETHCFINIDNIPSYA